MPGQFETYLSLRLHKESNPNGASQSHLADENIAQSLEGNVVSLRVFNIAILHSKLVFENGDVHRFDISLNASLSIDFPIVRANDEINILKFGPIENINGLFIKQRLALVSDHYDLGRIGIKADSDRQIWPRRFLFITGLQILNVPAIVSQRLRGFIIKKNTKVSTSLGIELRLFTLKVSKSNLSILDNQVTISHENIPSIYFEYGSGAQNHSKSPYFEMSTTASSTRALKYA
ncbi:MAG: hypothetical protein [Chaetfec virus UA24_144]|nr:MAG: hypothetical protein [Chaetfec virus UA24_144]